MREARGMGRRLRYGPSYSSEGQMTDELFTIIFTANHLRGLLLFISGLCLGTSFGLWLRR